MRSVQIDMLIISHVFQNSIIVRLQRCTIQCIAIVNLDVINFHRIAIPHEFAVRTNCITCLHIPILCRDIDEAIAISQRRRIVALTDQRLQVTLIPKNNTAQNAADPNSGGPAGIPAGNLTTGIAISNITSGAAYQAAHSKVLPIPGILEFNRNVRYSSAIYQIHGAGAHQAANASTAPARIYTLLIDDRVSGNRTIGQLAAGFVLSTCQANQATYGIPASGVVMHNLRTFV